MKRRLIALLLVFALLCPLLAVGAAADYTVYITDTARSITITDADISVNHADRYPQALPEQWDIRRARSAMRR